tara:strand:- start:410 stop:694 length:285 start_codon:yes stop_codon:yes gene_type:complete
MNQVTTQRIAQIGKPDRTTSEILGSITRLSQAIADGMIVLFDEDIDCTGPCNSSLTGCVNLLKRLLDEEVTHWLPQAMKQEEPEKAEPYNNYKV